MFKFLILALVGSVIATSADLAEDPVDADPQSSSKRRRSRHRKKHRSRKYYSSYVNTIVTNVTTPEGNLCTTPSKTLPIKNGQYFNIKNKNGQHLHHMIKIKLGSSFQGSDAVPTGHWFGFINSGSTQFVTSCPIGSLVLGINGGNAATTLGVTIGSTIKLRFKSKKSKKKRRGHSRHHSEGADGEEIEITEEIDEIEIIDDEILDVDDEDWHVHDQEEDDDVDSVFSEDPNDVDPLDSSKSRRNRKRKSSRKKKRKRKRKRKYKSTYQTVNIANVTSQGDLCTDATTLPISTGQYFYIMNENGNHHHHMIKIKLGSTYSTVASGRFVGFFNKSPTQIESQCPVGVLVIGIDNGDASTALGKVTGDTLKLRIKTKNSFALVVPSSRWGRHHSEGEEIEVEEETEEEFEEETDDDETEEEIDIDDENWAIFDAAEDVDRRMR